ncbi:beta-ketoacyl-[acyl-carrier-protein] synthase family protein [Candidatus Neptunichlamydia sp. REUL1]|uniref:beta-ketoacyl-[acyl-carrier-protein] synthase family protein n=1 Tax=Candidatus Neptunichlamydia sp. REUL1 TaxID=3064277 RepID=UPI00292E8EDD|nr:beta-ketoacyl-[acyl-carrier-protein] synthase family protein [Candidatus Neptunochlamydia sp. REUL1]
MTRNRVVITGLGTVNPLGKSVDEFWKNCIKGSSGISKITHLFQIPEHMSQIAGRVDLEYDSENSSASSRNQMFADMAVNEALKQSRLFKNDEEKRECAVMISTAIAEISVMEEMFNNHGRGEGHVDFVPLDNSYSGRSFCFNNVAQQIAQNHGIRGKVVTISTGCTGGNDAIGYALHMIRSGKIQLAISGSVDAPITPLVVSAFSRIGATSLRNEDPQLASRPYDSERDGFVLAEGCGILILENLSHALKRGAPILAEVAGFASVNNCYHMIDIHHDGLAISKSCKLALEDAKISANEVDFVNAHGSSTPQNDVAESHALHRVFKERTCQIPVTSIKSQLGHPLSAANSIELLSAVLSMRDRKIPPTVNLCDQDPECKLNIVGNKSLDHEVNIVMKPSSGFSGIHSCVILKECSDYER